MHTSHLANARRKTDRQRRWGWDARSRAETILVREFTSIFISPRRQLFTLAAAAGSCEPFSEFTDEIRGTIKRGDGGILFGGVQGGQERRKDCVRVGKDRWFRDRSKATATSDNYLPRRHSVLINSGASFKVSLLDLIYEYGSPSVYQWLCHTKKNADT